MSVSIDPCASPPLGTLSCYVTTVTAVAAAITFSASGAAPTPLYQEYQEHFGLVNFWQPGGRTNFRALQPGELFLFKLHAPRNFIVGGGVFARADILPVSLAWDAFGISNGAQSLWEMRKRIAYYRNQQDDFRQDYMIGCRILTQPFFFPEHQWIPIPASDS
jgi:hypothetical protein